MRCRSIATKINKIAQERELTDVLNDVAKITGKKFVVNQGVRGKMTILSNEKISAGTVWKTFLVALAENGFSYQKDGDYHRIMNVRDLQRMGIDVVTDLSGIDEERMITMVFKLKYVNASEVIKSLRFIASKNGEIYPWNEGNMLFMNDFTSSVRHTKQVIDIIDKPHSEATMAGERASPEGAMGRSRSPKTKPQLLVAKAVAAGVCSALGEPEARPR